MTERELLEAAAKAAGITLEIRAPEGMPLLSDRMREWGYLETLPGYFDAMLHQFRQSVEEAGGPIEPEKLEDGYSSKWLVKVDDMGRIESMTVTEGQWDASFLRAAAELAKQGA